MNKKTVQFNCVKCTTPVYRLSKKVDQVNKVCGKCNQDQPIETNNGCIVVQDTSESPQTSIGGQFYVQDKIKHYRAKLDQVEVLSQQDTNASFMDLWQKAV